jgi:hypothetical protein
LLKAEGERIQIRERGDGTSPDGLRLVTVEQVREVTNGAMTTRKLAKYDCELAIRRVER